MQLRPQKPPATQKPPRCFIDIPREIDVLADCDLAACTGWEQWERCVELLQRHVWFCAWRRGIVLSVTGCMHAQQQIEIDEIKKNGYQGQSSENGFRMAQAWAQRGCMQRRHASTHHELAAASAADDVSEGRAASLPRQAFLHSGLSVEGGH